MEYCEVKSKMQRYGWIRRSYKNRNQCVKLNCVKVGILNFIFSFEISIHSFFFLHYFFLYHPLNSLHSHILVINRSFHFKYIFYISCPPILHPHYYDESVYILLSFLSTFLCSLLRLSSQNLRISNIREPLETVSSFVKQLLVWGSDHGHGYRS